MFFGGKADGVFEVWDLKESRQRPSCARPVAAAALTCLASFNEAFLQQQTAKAREKTEASPRGPSHRMSTKSRKQSKRFTDLKEDALQWLAVGDAVGAVHVLSLDTNLVVPVSKSFFRVDSAPHPTPAFHTRCAMPGVFALSNEENTFSLQARLPPRLRGRRSSRLALNE